MTWGERSGVLPARGGSTEKWTGTIKSSGRLTATRRGAAHRGQKRAGMSSTG